METLCLSGGQDAPQTSEGAQPPAAALGVSLCVGERGLPNTFRFPLKDVLCRGSLAVAGPSSGSPESGL